MDGIIDCIAIYTEDLDKINLLLEFLNSLDENLKFPVEIGGKSLFLLYLKITINEKKLVISVYSKPADSLDGASCHPAKNINGISTRVAKRLKQICSNENDFFRTIEKISSLLSRE